MQQKTARMNTGIGSMAARRAAINFASKMGQFSDDDDDDIDRAADDKANDDIRKLLRDVRHRKPLPTGRVKRIYSDDDDDDDDGIRERRPAKQPKVVSDAADAVAKAQAEAKAAAAAAEGATNSVMAARMALNVALDAADEVMPEAKAAVAEEGAPAAAAAAAAEGVGAPAAAAAAVPGGAAAAEGAGAPAPAAAAVGSVEAIILPHAPHLSVRVGSIVRVLWTDNKGKNKTDEARIVALDTTTTKGGIRKYAMAIVLWLPPFPPSTTRIFLHSIDGVVTF